MKDRSNSETDYESFLYIITHDLKTYSRAMRVIPEWIEEDIEEAGLELPAPVQDHIIMLNNYARGMDRMLDGLTELSRVGRLAEPASAVDLRSAVMSAWQRVPGTERFALQIHGNEMALYGPSNDLDRLFYAILSNAVIHNDQPAGHVSVATHVLGERVILRVEDTGPGIEPAYREKVFDPLYTLKPKDEVGTAGVGLAIARKVAATLGGEIVLEASGEERGLAVVVDLPLSLN